MGISSLNSAIFYNVGLYFHYTNPSLSLRMTPKSCKYNKYPVPRPRKRAFSWTEKDSPKLSYQGGGAKLRQGFQINWNMVRLKYISG